MNYPLIKGFKATRIRNAFILNALVVAFTASLAIEITRRLDKKKSDIYIFMDQFVPGEGIGEYTKMLIVFITTLISSFMAYNLLHFVFGFGAAMIIDNKYKHTPAKY